MAARGSTARVPLRLCAWLPDGEGGEERQTLTWELAVAELPLLLDPNGSTPLHKVLTDFAHRALPSRKVDRLYWYGDRMQERTLWPASLTELTRNIFDVLQQALSRPRESVGSGGSADIHILMKPPPEGQMRPKTAPDVSDRSPVKGASTRKPGRQVSAAEAQLQKVKSMAPAPAGASGAKAPAAPGGSSAAAPTPAEKRATTSWNSAALRTALKSAESAMPQTLRESVPAIEFSPAMLKNLLGKGSEHVIPADDDKPLTASEVGAILLLWARRRVRQQQMRSRLTEQFRRTGKVARRLKQIMAGRPVQPAPKTDLNAVAAVFAAGNVGAAISPEPVYPPVNGVKVGDAVLDPRFKVAGRFRVRPLLWCKGLPPMRCIDAAFVPRKWGGTAWAVPGACLDAESGQFMVPKQVGLTSTMLVKMAIEKKNKNAPGDPDGVPVRPNPAPSPMAAVRTGARNKNEQLSGLHMRARGPDGLKLAEALLAQQRGVVLSMRADPDDGGDAYAIGECDMFAGMRWSACSAIGEPLQVAWGLAVAERLFSLWKKMNLAPQSGAAAGGNAKDPAGRHGLPDLPGVWCPPRPRAPARRPGRMDARLFLDLVLQQKRIHITELRGGYAYCCLGVPNAAELDGQNGSKECLLFQHAMIVLNSLKRGPEAQHRWVTLLEAQLSDESDEPVNAALVAGRLRIAAGKINSLEDVLREGLAERSDAAAALNMHVFNAYQSVPLAEQLQGRLSNTSLGELLGQRLEWLEQPDFMPKQLGCEGVAPFTRAAEPSKDPNIRYLPFLQPAGAASAPMALDNSVMNMWIALLPAMLRTAAPKRMAGVIAVGDPAAYDAKLDSMLRSMLGLKAPAPPPEEGAEAEVEPVLPPEGGAVAAPSSFKPSKQSMLCMCAIARYAWAAKTKGSDSQGSKTEHDRLEQAASQDGLYLKKKQIANIDTYLSVLIDRVRAATPKGAKPTDPALIAALRGESAALEADAIAIGLPTKDDVDNIREALGSILDLVQAAAQACTRRAPPKEGADFAMNNIAKSVRKMRESINEALCQSADIQDASRLDADGLLAVVAEAVGDVGVELSDLMRAVYKGLYRRTLDGVIGSGRIPTGPAKQFLQKLLVRKPCVEVPRLNALEWAAGKSMAMSLAIKEEARTKEDGGGALESAAAAIAGEVKGGEIEAAKDWTTRLAELLQLSVEGEQTLLKLITTVSLSDLRAIQGELSCPPPGGKKILLRDLVSNGVGGVAKQNMLRKLELAVVYDSDGPIELNKAYMLLPGREGAGNPMDYALPLRYAEGEELLRAGRGANVSQAARSLLDAGQRLRPDGSEYNVIRLHRIWAMQSAAADAAAELTLEKLMDEHVTLTLRSCFFNQTSEDEPVIKGKAEVMRYLINDGFSQLGVGGTIEAPKPKGEGCTFVQPVALTPDGDTRCTFGAGFKDASGSSKDRLRIGEQIKWGPWGVVLSLVRVFDPLPTHYEWAMRNHGGNFAGIKQMLHPGVVYYAITHHRAPAHAQTPPFSARVMHGSKGVFERLDNEMSRMIGKIGAISPALMGDKITDLQARREQLAGEEENEYDDSSEQLRAEREIARQAYAESVSWDSGAPGDAGPDISVLSFAGRWLPLGEGPKRAGDLVITVRETLGWKYQSKPPAKGNAKPSASRAIGLLIREFYIDTNITEAPPIAPGLAAAWALNEKRGGK